MSRAYKLLCMVAAYNNKTERKHGKHRRLTTTNTKGTSTGIVIASQLVRVGTDQSENAGLIVVIYEAA